MITLELRAIIEEKAAEFGIDPDLVQAFCSVESSYNPRATRYEPNFYGTYIRPMIAAGTIGADEAAGRATSWGLMQIMGQVAREKGFKGDFQDLLNADVGLEWSLRHLKRFIGKYKEMGLDYAIASYNAGSPRHKEDGSFVNQGYVDKIHKTLGQIRDAA